jgi:hypothetical protein
VFLFYKNQIVSLIAGNTDIESDLVIKEMQGQKKLIVVTTDVLSMVMIL